ncbi:MAG: universal stress protein, partial [Euryarchaeota archaeon]|nr:universal stress protein [Euryarchaeota archaeon]
MLFDKVLVPVDLGIQSGDQVDCVICMKDYGMRQAVLYFAVNVGDQPTSEEQAMLDALAAKMTNAGIDVKVVAEPGKPSTMILKAAKKEKVTLIAMSSVGKTK